MNQKKSEKFNTSWRALKSRREIVGLRSANRKVFENPDHSRTAEITFSPVHVRGADGTWAEWDDSFKMEKGMEQTQPDTGGAAAQEVGEKEKLFYVNRNGNLTCRFAAVSSETVTGSLSDGSHMLTWGLGGADKVSAVRDGETLYYKDIRADVDLKCCISEGRIKEDLVLKTPDAVKEFYYLYDAGSMKAVLAGTDVVFLDEKGNDRFRLASPFMRDSGGRLSDKVKLGVLPDGDGRWRITLQPDRKWLESPERTYPVVIDPFLTSVTDVNEIQDASVDSAMETHNNYLGYYLYCAGNYHICRSYLKFVLPEISSGDMVTGAYLRLYSNTPEAGNQTVKAHRILGDWTSQTLNWNNKPLFEEETLDFYKYTSNNAGRPILLDITRAVKEWYNGGVNNGIMIRNEYEVNGDGVYWASDIDDDYVAARPCIVITYANTSGLEGRFSYHSQAAGRNGTVHVNDYNGNLILIHQTMATGGSLMPVSLQHVYNTNDRLTDLGYGYGWRLSLMQTIEEVTGSDVTYYRHTDSDGTAHYFYHDTDDNSWKDEADPKRILTFPSGTDSHYMITDEASHSCQVFNSAGRLTEMKDRNHNTLSITYEDGKIIRVTDGAGRHITLAYHLDSTGAKTTLASVTSPAEQTKYFSYDNAGNLTQITDIDGTVLFYTYDASTHALTGITCPDGYHLAYDYYEDSCRVRDIREYGGTEVGGSLHISYDRNSTTYTTDSVNIG